MYLRALKFACLASNLALFGCGIYPPEFQEFWGNRDDADKKILVVVKQVECELRDALRRVESSDIHLASDEGTKPKLEFLNKWVVDAAFIFTIDEKSSLNPGLIPGLRQNPKILRVYDSEVVSH
jgi:hypothetical protein